MDLNQTLRSDLDHLEASLAQLADVESERAGSNDPPFAHFGPLALSSHPTYSQVRAAFAQTFDPELEPKSKLGRDWGGRLLVLALRKLLEVGELEGKGRVYQALSWVATVQEGLDELYVPPVAHKPRASERS
jgi:hypothetical protein